jgi:hypothetical protein
MPAIQLSRLKSEISHIIKQFNKPVDFHRQLSDLFERYANRIYRPGKNVKVKTKHSTYRVHRIVIQQIEISLIPLCESNIEAAIRIAEKLWSDNYLEPKLIAATIIGMIPPNPPDPVIEQIKSWARPDEDSQVLDALFDRGCSQLRKEAQSHWSEMIKEQWLAKTDDKLIQAIGLRALLSATKDPEFTNLPEIYKLITPFLQSDPREIQNVLHEILINLASRAPNETGYFLRQIIVVSSSNETSRIIRQAIHAFPKDVQEKINLTMKLTPTPPSE